MDLMMVFKRLQYLVILAKNIYWLLWFFEYNEGYVNLQGIKKLKKTNKQKLNYKETHFKILGYAFKYGRMYSVRDFIDLYGGCFYWKKPKQKKHFDECVKSVCDYLGIKPIMEGVEPKNYRQKS